MSKTQGIADRLPQFYKTREEGSLLLKFLDSFAKTLSEQEKDIFRIMRGHWIDTAKGGDLDLLGSAFKIVRQKGELDTSLRRRIKRALQEYKGGGTIAAIQLALRSILAPYSDQLQIVEFPETPIAFEVEATSGSTWKAASLGIRDVTPKITISLRSKDEEVRDPRVINLDLGASVGMNGVLKSGRELVLAEGKGTLDGEDVTSRLTSNHVPPILRKGSEWQYTDLLQGKIGVFDTGLFDEAFFATPLPTVRIRFDWTTRKASTVEVRIPSIVMERIGMKENAISSALESIKALGVEMRLVIEGVETKTSLVIPATQGPTPPSSPEIAVTSGGKTNA
jgi:hypothetical protein